MIPDSVSTDFLRNLAPLKQLSQNSCLKELEFGDLGEFEGLFDHYMLNCLAIDAAKSGNPNSVQILITVAGLTGGLLSHMETTRQQIIDDASLPGAQAILDNLSPGAAQAVRDAALHHVDNAIDALRLVSQKLEAVKAEWVHNFLIAQYAETGRTPQPSTEDNSFISDRFLASVGINRADFNACMDRPGNR